MRNALDGEEVAVRREILLPPPTKQIISNFSCMGSLRGTLFDRLLVGSFFLGLINFIKVGVSDLGSDGSLGESLGCFFLPGLVGYSWLCPKLSHKREPARFGGN